MKKEIAIVISILLFAAILSGQELETVELLPPESSQTHDLNFLVKTLEGKQVVMLGEQTHLYGSIFLMKGRLFEFLHKELGFTTLAIEAPMYDVWKSNIEGFTAEGFNNALFGVWSNSAEFQRIVDYIIENDINVVGFDPQIMDTSSFVDNFLEFCNQRRISLTYNEDDIGIIMEGIIDDYSYDSFDISYPDFEKEIGRIVDQMETLPDTEDNFHWLQFTKGFLAMLRDAHENEDPILSYHFINGHHNIRDRQMADNLLTLFNRFPEEKVVVWSDNIHIMNDNSSIEQPIAKDFISMGNFIKDTLGEKAFSIATIHANDSIYDEKERKWDITPILLGSFEDVLSQKEKPYLFVNANQVALKDPMATRLLNFLDFYDVQLNQVHDAYIFLKNAEMPKHIQQRISGPDKIGKGKDSGNDIVRSENNILTFKGQLMDSVSNSPIAFANLIMEEEEIYGIADQDGNFELSVPQHMWDQSSVTISSLGYEEETIQLNELKELVYLNPRYESLQEVVITGKTTPLSVLKQAVKNKYKNHPEEPFNYSRYSHFGWNQEDKTFVDLEVLTKDYEEGLSSGFVSSNRVEQIRWNKNLIPNGLSNTRQLFGFREDALQFSNILHKRKYKKFDLEFVRSKTSEDNDSYIISFRTHRDKWNYTNRSYPTDYSGKVYIDREDFAILKVEESWETHLDKDEVKKYYKTDKNYNNDMELVIKEESISYYTKTINEKHYPSKYYTRRYTESHSNGEKISNNLFEVDSYLYNHELEDVEEIDFEHVGRENFSLLNRVDYNPEFWNDFDQ